tara:strand:- start:16 stop:297 length:282 start_codon:yes stop_codon:yes gene_type:complete
MLRKIPLGPLIEILTDLFENGADFIDLSGNVNDDGETPRDTLKITVKPEYLSLEEEDEEDIIDYGMDFLINNETDTPSSSSSPFSKDDIEDLI